MCTGTGIEALAGRGFMDLILIATPANERPCAELASLFQARTSEAVAERVLA